MQHSDDSKADLALTKYFEDNLPITSEQNLHNLHSRFAGSSQETIVYRGLLFDTFEQMNSCKEDLISSGKYDSFIASATSTDKKIAEGFSTHQKTFGVGKIIRNGEIVDGFGLLLELSVNGADCIDMSLAGKSSESEMLLMPRAEARVLSVTPQLPLSYQFENGFIEIDQALSDNDTPHYIFNYILKNFVQGLSVEQVGLLFNRLGVDTDKDNARMVKEDMESVDYDQQDSSELIYLPKGLTRASKGFFVDSGIYIIEQDIVLREYILDNKVGLICDTMPDGMQIELLEKLYEEGLNSSDNAIKAKMLSSYSELSKIVRNRCDNICNAILTASQHKDFKAKELSVETSELLKSYASPLMYHSVFDAITGNVMADYIELMDGLTNSRQITMTDLKNHSYAMNQKSAVIKEKLNSIPKMNIEKLYINPVESGLKQDAINEGVEGALAFECQAFANAEVLNFKSRNTLVYLEIDEFLKLAESGFDAVKFNRCKEIMSTGDIFDSLPYLNFAHDGAGNARVIGHEGRHRARILQEMGVKTMPVVLKSYGDEDGMSIRWGNQDDSFDSLALNGQVFPTTLKSEDENYVTKMPQSVIFKQETPQLESSIVETLSPNKMRP